MKQFLLLIFLFTVIIRAISQDLEVVVPDYGNSTMFIKWTAVNNATSYEVQRSELGTGNWITVVTTSTLSYTDNNIPSTALDYEYRVKANNKNKYSNTRRGNFKKVWPVGADKNTCDAKSMELLHSFQQPIGGKNGNPISYLHEGVDIQGEQTVSNECVVAPLGGVVTAIERASTNDYRFIIRVLLNGQIRHISFSHLAENKNIKSGTSVYAGEELSKINPNFPSSWSVLERHTHMQAWTGNVGTSDGANLQLIYNTTINPLTLFDDPAHKDPKGQTPKVADTNRDSYPIRFKKGPHSMETNDYLPDNNLVYGPVDIVAEVYDAQSKDAPWQAPKNIGYYIQRETAPGAYTDAIKSATNPYKLIDGDTWFTANTAYFEQVKYHPQVMDALVDFDQTLKATKPTGYEFNQWFTYIVTNTKGENGQFTNLDANQCWATKAPSGNANNGYNPVNYDAGTVESHQFQDGHYKINIVAEDLVGHQATSTKVVTLDNFQPFVEQVIVKITPSKKVALA